MLCHETMSDLLKNTGCAKGDNTGLSDFMASPTAKKVVCGEPLQDKCENDYIQKMNSFNNVPRNKSNLGFSNNCDVTSVKENYQNCEGHSNNLQHLNYPMQPLQSTYQTPSQPLILPIQPNSQQIQNQPQLSSQQFCNSNISQQQCIPQQNSIQQPVQFFQPKENTKQSYNQQNNCLINEMPNHNLENNFCQTNSNISPEIDLRLQPSVSPIITYSQPVQQPLFVPPVQPMPQPIQQQFNQPIQQQSSYQQQCNPYINHQPKQQYCMPKTYQPNYDCNLTYRQTNCKPQRHLQQMCENQIINNSNNRSIRYNNNCRENYDICNNTRRYDNNCREDNFKKENHDICNNTRRYNNNCREDNFDICENEGRRRKNENNYYDDYNNNQFNKDRNGSIIFNESDNNQFNNGRYVPNNTDEREFNYLLKEGILVIQPGTDLHRKVSKIFKDNRTIKVSNLDNKLNDDRNGRLTKDNVYDDRKRNRSYDDTDSNDDYTRRRNRNNDYESDENDRRRRNRNKNGNRNYDSDSDEKYTRRRNKKRNSNNDDSDSDERYNNRRNNDDADLETQNVFQDNRIKPRKKSSYLLNKSFVKSNNKKTDNKLKNSKLNEKSKFYKLSKLKNQDQQNNNESNDKQNSNNNNQNEKNNNQNDKQENNNQPEPEITVEVNLDDDKANVNVNNKQKSKVNLDNDKEQEEDLDDDKKEDNMKDDNKEGYLKEKKLYKK
ncbi:hypothetical protein NAPIS_ORF01564 [Vairimorpha apis BRL 01]|uniref:Chitin-binding type-2 domain-containing protein n=1 Tax=Vairimorpha apis BRL 01 TaxID=1037528 RepID=T0MIP7_9MICR|nr:hypothetical protein NAPIS_ORF01564 [Vairimorpha apis BRL 01]